MKRNTPQVLLILAPPFMVPDAPHLGLHYLREALHESGIDVRVLDLNRLAYFAADAAQRRYWTVGYTDDRVDANKIAPVFDDLYPLIEPLLAPYFAAPPVLVGFSLYHLNVAFSALLAEKFRSHAPCARIVVGGPSVQEYDQRLKLAPHLIDFAFCGEAEHALVDLAQAVVSGREPGDVHGLIRPAQYHDRELPPGSTLVEDVRALPFPTFPGYEPPPGTDPFLPIVLARGCPNRCEFCDGGHLRYRPRSVESVMAEIAHHMQRHGVRRFFFCDQTLSADLPRLERLCRGLIRESLDIEWWGQLHIRDGLSPDLLKLMRAAGCTRLNWGVESFSDAILARMNKKSTSALALAALENAHRAGIKSLIYLIAGFPGETDATIAETIAGIGRASEIVDEFSVMPCQAPPATAIGRTPERFGIAPAAPWDKHAWRAADGANTREKRLEWMHRICAAICELNAPFSCPIYDGKHFENFLGPIYKHGVYRPPVARGSLGADLEWRFTGGRLHLLRSGQPLLEDLGMFFDWDIHGARAFSHGVDWAVDGNGDLRGNAGSIRWRLRFSTATGSVTVSLFGASDPPVSLTRIKINLVLSKSYTHWRIGDDAGDLPREAAGDPWSVMGPTASRGREWILTGNDAVREIRFACHSEGFQPILQARCEPGSSAGFIHPASIELTENEAELIRVAIGIGGWVAG